MPYSFAYDATRESLLHPCRAPFFSGWQPRTAVALCCELSRLAYCHGEVVREGLAAVSMRLVAEFANGGTYAFLAEGAGSAVLAFRGTESEDPTDIIDDARFLPQPWQGGGTAHAGFADALLRVWPAVEAALPTLREPLLLTGHSLGAALATLAATLTPAQRLITFGSPRVGNAEFCAQLAARVVADRFVNCCDLVCQIPPATPYQHFGVHRYIDRTGTLRTEPPSWLVAGDQAAAHVEYVRDYAWRFGTLSTRSLADHAPINYVSVLCNE